MMRIAAVVLAVVSLTACSGGGRPAWQGSILRDAGERLPFVGYPFYSEPRFDAYLDGMVFTAGAWMEDPVDGAFYAQSGFIIESTAGTTSTSPDPIELGDELPILHFGADRQGSDWWVHTTWIEELADDEAEPLFRYVYDNSAGEVDGTFVITDSDYETWLIAEVAVTVTTEYGSRDIDMTINWGPFKD